MRGVLRIAYIILAHKNEEQLAMLINQLKEDWCDVFLHIDKKSSLDPSSLLNKLASQEIYFTKQRHSVYWGSYSTVEAILELLGLVRDVSVQKKEKYDRIVFLSGQDFPIVSNEHILDFFEKNQDINKNYCTLFLS